MYLLHVQQQMQTRSLARKLSVEFGSELKVDNRSCIFLPVFLLILMPFQEQLLLGHFHLYPMLWWHQIFVPAGPEHISTTRDKFNNTKSWRITKYLPQKTCNNWNYIRLLRPVTKKFGCYGWICCLQNFSICKFIGSDETQIKRIVLQTWIFSARHITIFRMRN